MLQQLTKPTKTQNKKFKNAAPNNQPKRASKLCLRRSQRKSLCVITVPIRRVARAFQTKNSALPGVQYAENAKSKIIFKIQRNVNDCTQRGKAIKQINQDGEEHFYEVVDKICVLSQHSDDRKAFANLLLSKNKIPVTLQIDSGSTCSILPVNVHKDISQDLNTSIRPVLFLYNEETKIQTMGTRKVFVFNLATEEEAIIQFRIVDKDLTPLPGLSDSESLKLFELLQENIALMASAKPRVSPIATDRLAPLTMDTILANCSDVFDDSVRKLEGPLHLYTRDDVPPHKTAPRSRDTPL